MVGKDSMRARAARDVDSWDFEADVVIVGYGGAGVGAAIESASAGAETLVLERAGGPGGASFMSGGYIYAGGGTWLQKELGFEDSADNMYDFLINATGPHPNEDKIRMYSDESVEFIDWIRGHGVEFYPAFYEKPTWQITGEYGLGYSGGENAHPWNEFADPAPRAHVPYKPGFGGSHGGEAGAGSVLMSALLDAAEKLGVKHEYDIKVLRLIEDDNGRIVGVEARRYGKDLSIRARRGVVLAGGGFMANDRMLSRHNPALVGEGLVGTDGDDGRSILMAQAVGAAVQMMDRAESTIMVDAEVLYPSIIVNRYGQRFVNEDTYPGRVGQAVLTHQEKLAYVLFDEAIMDAIDVSTKMNYQIEPTWVSESLEELEELAGLPEGALVTTVDYYNRWAAKGEDPMFHKNPNWLREITGPFGLKRIDRVASFTLGGLVTHPTGEVLAVDDEPIDGLYAAGRAASGVPGYLYLSGSSLGDSIFFGRKAGASAARMVPVT